MLSKQVFPKLGQETVVLVAAGWSQGGTGALGWHRDVDAHGRGGMGTAGAGAVKMRMLEHEEAGWGQGDRGLYSAKQKICCARKAGLR